MFFNDFFNLQKELQELMHSTNSFKHWIGPYSAGIPLNVNVFDKGDALVVTTELPGINKENIEISISNNELSLKVTRPKQQVPSKEDNGNFFKILRQENEDGIFNKKVTLPLPVSEEKTTASFEDGVLFIELGKKEEAKPKTISIK